MCRVGWSTASMVRSTVRPCRSGPRQAAEAGTADDVDPSLPGGSRPHSFLDRAGADCPPCSRRRLGGDAERLPPRRVKAAIGRGGTTPRRRKVVASRKADLRVIRRDEISAGYIKTVGLFDAAEVEPHLSALRLRLYAVAQRRHRHRRREPRQAGRRVPRQKPSAPQPAEDATPVAVAYARERRRGRAAPRRSTR